MPAAACTRRPRVCGDAGAVPCRPQHTGRTAACECRQPNAMIALSLLHHAPINWWGTVVRTLSSRQCPEGSRKIRATRRAQDRRSPLTVKRARTHAAPTLPRALGAGDAGSRSGLRGTRAVGRPAKVAHPLASGVPRGSSLSQPLSVTSKTFEGVAAANLAAWRGPARLHARRCWISHRAFRPHRLCPPHGGRAPAQWTWCLA